MSVPHVHTRVADGQSSLLFGPYAGFSPKFLKTGSWLDLPASIRLHNLWPMLAVARDNGDLMKYLIGELLASKKKKLEALREFMPTAAGGGTIPAYPTGGTYNDGDLVSYKGSIWQLNTQGAPSASPGTPGASSRWKAVTYAFTGTVRVGATVGDETRDTYLASDSVHPMPDASASLAILCPNAVRDDLVERAHVA